MFHHGCNCATSTIRSWPFLKTRTFTVDVLSRGIYSLPMANKLKILNQAASIRCSDDNKEKLSSVFVASLRMISAMTGNPPLPLCELSC